MSGTKGRSGRRRKATARFRGETWVRLSMVDYVSIKGVTFDRFKAKSGSMWHVGDNGFDGFTTAAAEFVRRVNEAQ